jgi:hypothetical protein
VSAILVGLVAYRLDLSPLLGALGAGLAKVKRIDPASLPRPPAVSAEGRRQAAGALRVRWQTLSLQLREQLGRLRTTGQPAGAQAAAGAETAQPDYWERVGLDLPLEALASLRRSDD